MPITTYRFRTAQGVDAKEASRTLESSFLENGAEAVSLKEVIDEEIAVNNAFNNLLIGFMGMGLIVGVAALGVISLRAVVERRQHVGVLRAIGYRQSMIQLSFLVEASFVSLLGVGIGVALGAILSFNLVEGIQDQIPGPSILHAVVADRRHHRHRLRICHDYNLPARPTSGTHPPRRSPPLRITPLVPSRMRCPSSPFPHMSF